MTTLKEYLEKPIEEFWASQPQTPTPDRTGLFSNPNATVPGEPVSPPVQLVRDYRWACELVLRPLEVRRQYGDDAELGAAYQAESKENFPDAFRKKFYLKG